MAIRLTSPAFTEGASIPARHTCYGKDLSPPLKWRGAPLRTRNFALTCDDPDAPGGDWVYWVLYNIPPSVTEIPEGIPLKEVVLNSAKQGLNDFRRIGYGGPCPPPGGPHRYVFKLYALNTELSLKPGAAMRDLLRAMEGNILAEGQLKGTYKRK
ncbi:MAG: YbhB/YbcL family Raf kinase inhibitor-like protein [Candidatus Latescibacteria bacterium]|nr:YbhB/YbcL family Raf kinase inhibitor-like protein [Candidatus Latescibacterota bacterium]